MVRLLPRRVSDTFTPVAPPDETQIPLLPRCSGSTPCSAIAVMGLAVFVVIALAAIFAPWITPRTRMTWPYWTSWMGGWAGMPSAARA
jgi:hypothetical protein